MLKINIFIILILISCRTTVEITRAEKIDTTNGYHQPQPFGASNAKTRDIPTSFTEISIEYINSEQLKAIMNDSKQYKLITFLTSSCQGVFDAIKTAKYVDSLYPQFSTVLISSDNLGFPENLQRMRKLLQEYHYFDQTYIIDSSVANFKDSRKRSQLVREEVFPVTSGDEIGVPYKLVLDPNNNVLFSGYGLYSDRIDSVFKSLNLKAHLD